MGLGAAMYSMAMSTVGEAPCGLEFLYSLNRFKAAGSRAQCLSAIVASPDPGSLTLQYARTDFSLPRPYAG
jgi:hypothetical protein